MTLTCQWIGDQNMYLQYHIMLISSEEPKEEDVGISQVSPVMEEVAIEEEVYLDIGEVEEVALDMDKVKVEKAVDAVVVVLEVVV